MPRIVKRRGRRLTRLSNLQRRPCATIRDAPHEFAEALRALNAREVAAGGDGFVESFPVPALTVLLQARLGRAQLTKADWIALSAILRSQ